MRPKEKAAIWLQKRKSGSLLKTLDAAVWNSIRAILGVGSKFYGIKAHGFEKARLNEAAVFGVYHQSNMDLPLMLHALPRRTTIFATKELFANPLANYLLKVAGVVPLYASNNQKALKLDNTDYATERKVNRALKSGGWVAYAPSGKRVLKDVGSAIYPQMLRKAAKHGISTYLIGIKYRASNYPWLSWLRIPFLQNGVEIRTERIGMKDIKRERTVEKRLRLLSGLK